jgi:multiple sugar transport system ATP-binding protein
MADRIAVMNEGRIEQLGRPLELYDRPANLFVAQFIGSPAMNVFDGTVRGGAVDGLGASWPVAAKASDGQRVKYGIRPEHLVIGASGVPAVVEVVEPMGAETEFLVKVQEQPFTVVTHGRPSVGPGDKVFLEPSAQNAHLFDAESGLRIG